MGKNKKSKYVESVNLPDTVKEEANNVEKKKSNKKSKGNDGQDNVPMVDTAIETSGKKSKKRKLQVDIEKEQTENQMNSEQNRNDEVVSKKKKKKNKDKKESPKVVDQNCEAEIAEELRNVQNGNSPLTEEGNSPLTEENNDVSVDKQKKKKKKKKQKSEKENGTTNDVVSENGNSPTETTEADSQSGSNSSLADRLRRVAEYGGDGDATVGQWASAGFENTDRQNKFFKLLGGFKGKSNSAAIENKFKSGGGNAMDKDQQEMYTKNMESDFDRALSSNMNRGIGLGFHRPADADKKFHIDVKQSKSIKFDD